MTTTLITVRLWAGAREAAGTGEITLPGSELPSMEAVLAHVLDAVAPDRRDRLSRVVAACSVLVDGRGIAGRDPAEVLVRPGQVVELLPPFAGG